MRMHNYDNVEGGRAEAKYTAYTKEGGRGSRVPDVPGDQVTGPTPHRPPRYIPQLLPPNRNIGSENDYSVVEKQANRKGR